MFEKFRNVISKSPEAVEAQKDFERYKKWLHLDEGQLRGKTILDVGSAKAQFGEYVEKKFPGTRVIRFDYHVRKDEPSDPARINFRARADQLPLKHDSVDMALAHASITNNSGEEMLAALKEIFATVKTGGEIRIAPVTMPSNKESQERLKGSQGRIEAIREYINALEKEGTGSAEWIDDGIHEWKGPKGECFQEKRYCLVIKKAEDPIHS